MTRQAQYIFIFLLTFSLSSSFAIYFIAKKTQSIQARKIEAKQIIKQSDKSCFCSENTEMNGATVSCDVTDLRNGSKLYWQYNCDRIWLTLEKTDGEKMIIDEGSIDLFGYTYRLSYHFLREYDKYLLFRYGCPANGPCFFALVDKETGKIEREFGQLIYTDEKLYDFVLYFSYKSYGVNSIIAEFVDSNKKFEIPVNKSYFTQINPEYQFAEISYENHIISLTYNDRGKKRILTIDTRGKVEKRFEKYLSKHEIKPLITLDNDYMGVRRKGEEIIKEVKVSKHKITWFHSFEEIKIKINNDLFSLEDKLSLNNADEERKIDGDFVNNWDEIKYYKIKGRELIAISMHTDLCTGLSCSVSFFLVYDLKTKSKNFFGTYKTDYYLGLYDFKRDGTIDYLAKNFKANGSLGIAAENQHIYNLYTLDKKGKFRLKKNRRRSPYFIKRTFDGDNYEEFEDKFKQNWIEKIK